MEIAILLIIGIILAAMKTDKNTDDPNSNDYIEPHNKILYGQYGKK